MKALTLFGLLLAVSPASAFAQTTAPDAAPPHPNFAAMEQVHAQMKQIHQQARLQMLAALTPAHRALLANVVGQLAIAPNPDRSAAARAIDAALSQNEGRSILTISANARTQSRALMESAQAQFEASLTADQRARLQGHVESRGPEQSVTKNGQAFAQRQNDPGEQLLELATGGGHDRFFMTLHGPGGPPPQ